MRTRLCLFGALLLAAVGHAQTNVAPTVTIVSAAMRPSTTLMDVTYRITDPDDATVKVRALAFVNGDRSFANVIRPTTFVEATATNIGDAIISGVDHKLTWDVRADWNTDLGQLKFEILCRDSRGLLPIGWITIPAAGGQPVLTISTNAPTDAQVLDALFWQYAAGDPGLTLTNGVLLGNTNSGIFSGVNLVNGASIQNYASTYIYKLMNLCPATGSEVKYAANVARAGLADLAKWHVDARPYNDFRIIAAWGDNSKGQNTVPVGLSDVTAIAAGNWYSLALKRDGTVIGWGSNDSGQIDIPSGLTGVTAIAAGFGDLALKSNGTVVAWGYGITNVPAGLTGVTAIASGGCNLALKSDGTVVAWGDNSSGQADVPIGLTNVTAIAAGGHYSLALKSDGTVVAWGGNTFGQTDVPAGLTGVTAIAAALGFHSLALKSDGTVVAWGWNNYGQTDVPAGLTGVTAIATGLYYSLALKSNGTVVAWGYGITNVPTGLSGVITIAAGWYHNLAVSRE